MGARQQAVRADPAPVSRFPIQPVKQRRARVCATREKVRGWRDGPPKAAMGSPLLFRAEAPGTEPVVLPHRPHHARRFRTASSSDNAKTQSAPDPAAGPALKGISSTDLTVQRARARRSLRTVHWTVLPATPDTPTVSRPVAAWRSTRHAPRGFKKRPRDAPGFVAPGMPHDAGLPHVTDVPERPRPMQAGRKLGRFSGRARWG
jgi:hypothetical protein